MVDLSRYTHKGWFGLCPVYVGGVDTDAWEMTPRHQRLQFWLDANIWTMGVAVWCWAFFDRDWRPGFPIRVTGRINRK